MYVYKSTLLNTSCKIQIILYNFLRPIIILTKESSKNDVYFNILFEKSPLPKKKGKKKKKKNSCIMNIKRKLTKVPL